MRRWMKKSEVQARLAELDPSMNEDSSEEDSDLEDLSAKRMDSQYIATIRKMMKFVGMDVKTVSDEWTGETYYCIANVEQDLFASEFTSFEQWELSLFKQVVRKIVSNAYGSPKITIDQFLKEGRVCCKKDDKIRNLLIKLQSRGWIVGVTRENALRLGPRTFVELSSFLDELKCPVCPMCLIHVVYGVKPCDTCPVRAHKHCAQTQRTGAMTAPCTAKDCPGSWKKRNNDDGGEEDEFEMDEDED
jgi:hypothetical protein